MISDQIKHRAPALHQWWTQRPAREQRALRILAACLLLALLLQGLWLLETKRRQLRQQLPRLAAQVEQMKVLEQAWLALASANPSPAGSLPRAEIERQASALGREVQLQWSANGDLQLKGKTRLDAWLAWTAQLHEEHRLVLSESRLLPRDGGIEVEARYSRPTP